MKRLLQVGTVLLFMALLGLGIILASGFIQRPLAEPMNLQVKAVTATPTALQPQEKVSQPETCGNTGTMTVLFTGADFSGGVPPLGADAVRIVKFDFSNKKMVVVAFPRDMLLKTDGLKDLNRPEERLGLAYYYKKQATNGADKHKITVATELVAQTLYDNFGVQPEQYFTLQLDNVQEMIDTIGGVEVTLPEEITTDQDVTFPAGTQTLDGKLSTEFVRAYKPGGDAARLKRQNLFIKALQSKVLY